MTPERKGGLGRGLAALIPSAPVEPSGKTPGIGGDASEVIFGAPTVKAKKESKPVHVGLSLIHI